MQIYYLEACRAVVAPGVVFPLFLLHLYVGRVSRSSAPGTFAPKVDSRSQAQASKYALCSSWAMNCRMAGPVSGGSGHSAAAHRGLGSIGSLSIIVSIIVLFGCLLPLLSRQRERNPARPSPLRVAVLALILPVFGVIEYCLTKLAGKKTYYSLQCSAISCGPILGSAAAAVWLAGSVLSLESGSGQPGAVTLPRGYGNLANVLVVASWNHLACVLCCSTSAWKSSP